MRRRIDNPFIQFFYAGIFFLGIGIADPKAQNPSWEDLEARGAVISRIEIKTNNVFDASKPGESHWLARAANFVHITTKEHVVRREVLFREGEKVNARLVHETERNLRACDFIREAIATPVVDGEGRVTARVEVWDSWTLRLSAKYNQAGGQNEWNIRLHEGNLLGLGKSLRVGYEKDIERTSEEIAYRDLRLLGSRWGLELKYEDLSDGRAWKAELGRPFFSLATPWSAAGFAEYDRSTLTLYDWEKSIYKVPSTSEEYSLSAAWVIGARDRTAHRLGVELRSSEVNYGPLQTLRPGILPEPALQDRRFRGPLLTWALAQDQFGTFRDMRVMGFTEDYNLGWDVEAAAGYFAESLGSLENASYGEVQVEKGWMPGGNTLLLLESETQARFQDGAWHDSFTRTAFSAYNRSLKRQTLAAMASLDGGTRLDPEHWLYLGGFDGLRGFGNHFRAGDRRWMVNLEDRFITDKVLWGILQVGFVAYADLGSIRAFDPGKWTEVYANVGAGFRFGDLKTAFGKILQLTVAVPLDPGPGQDRYQFIFGNVVRF